MASDTRRKSLNRTLGNKVVQFWSFSWCFSKCTSRKI